MLRFQTARDVYKKTAACAASSDHRPVIFIFIYIVRTRHTPLQPFVSCIRIFFNNKIPTKWNKISKNKSYSTSWMLKLHLTAAPGRIKWWSRPALAIFFFFFAVVLYCRYIHTWLVFKYITERKRKRYDVVLYFVYSFLFVLFWLDDRWDWLSSLMFPSGPMLHQQTRQKGACLWLLAFWLRYSCIGESHDQLFV